MAEAIGTIASVMTIAKLFKACVDAFDLVQAARHQEKDYNRLLVKFNVEKCRLDTWGQMMGLKNTLQPNEPRPLDEFQFRDIVVQTLQTLHELFNDSPKIQERYGYGKAPALAVNGSDQTQLAWPLATASLHFTTGPRSGREQKLGQKTRWVIKDRKKFAGLVSQVKDLVDGLQEITKPIASITLQQTAMIRRITTVADVETLQAVSEVCEEDHPLFSQAASLRSEALSTGDARRTEIEAWLVDGAPPLDPNVTDLEDMDLPGLKHHVFSLSKERQQLEDEATRLSSSIAAHLDDADLISERTKREKVTIIKIWIAALIPVALLNGFITRPTSTFPVQSAFWAFWVFAILLTALTTVVYCIDCQNSELKTKEDKLTTLTTEQIGG